MAKNLNRINADIPVTTKLTQKNFNNWGDLVYYSGKSKLEIINQALEDYYKKNFKKFKEGKK